MIVMICVVSIVFVATLWYGEWRRANATPPDCRVLLVWKILELLDDSSRWMTSSIEDTRIELAFEAKSKVNAYGDTQLWSGPMFITMQASRTIPFVPLCPWKIVCSIYITVDGSQSPVHFLIGPKYERKIGKKACRLVKQIMLSGAMAKLQGGKS